AGAERGDQRPKVVRALGARAVDPPDVVRLSLGRSSTVAESARGAIAAAFLRLVDHHPGVQLDEDPEDVHQARVATRRLRSDLKTFGAVLDRKWVDHARGELAWLADGLGGVRDADVLLERLRSRFSRLSSTDVLVAQRLVRRLVAQRDEALASLRDMIGSQRYLEMLEVLASAAVVLPLAQPTDEAGDLSVGTHGGNDGGASGGQAVLADDLVCDASARLVDGPWKHLRRAVDALGPDPEDESLHEVRIRAKRLRYASEALAGSVGRPATELASAAAALQEVLGNMHDAVVAEEWLRAAAVDASVEDALVTGQLIAVEREIAEGGRAGWKDAWDRLDRKKMRAWLR
ncbi:MAG: CHAD domain-containing protein, partial [Acidimicrobiales bacterium]